jgi:hypothetical protein
MTEGSSVTDQMKSLIQTWRGCDDRREVFLSCYLMMTENMLAAIRASEFEDNPWVAGLLDRFARYYFNALGTYEREPASAPVAWQIAFHAARNPRTHVLQHLGLGVNAHINYDLVFALGDLLAPEWAGLSGPQREARYRDHCRVNTVIAETVDAVQDQVIEPLEPAFDLADKLLGPLDEWLTARFIREWRERVWERATGLIEMQSEARGKAVKEVEKQAVDRARAILGEAGIAGVVGLV